MNLRPISVPFLAASSSVVIATPGDRHFLRHDGINAFGEAELNRAAHLAAVERSLDERRHHRAERANIEVMAAHILHQLLVNIRIGFFQCFQIRFLMSRRFESGFVAGIERHAVFDVNAEARAHPL